MAKKLFGGKETYSEELKEAKALKSGKISAKQFVKGEKSEGHKDEENPSLIAREIKKGSMSPKQYASVESKEKDMKKTKKMAVGGPTLPAQAAQQATDALARRPAMPSQSNAGGAMRGLDRAAAMSGRDFSNMGRPEDAGKARPVGMKKGGMCKGYKAGGKTSQLSKANGIAVRGKSKGKIV